MVTKFITGIRSEKISVQKLGIVGQHVKVHIGYSKAFYDTLRESESNPDSVENCDHSDCTHQEEE